MPTTLLRAGLPAVQWQEACRAAASQSKASSIVPRRALTTAGQRTRRRRWRVLRSKLSYPAPLLPPLLLSPPPLLLFLPAPCSCQKVPCLALLLLKAAAQTARGSLKHTKLSILAAKPRLGVPQGRQSLGVIAM